MANVYQRQAPEEQDYGVLSWLCRPLASSSSPMIVFKMKVRETTVFAKIRKFMEELKLDVQAESLFCIRNYPYTSALFSSYNLSVIR